MPDPPWSPSTAIPAMVVRPESAPLLLTDLDQKLELLAATGVDVTAVVHFDEERANESPEDFVQEVLVDVPGRAEPSWSARTSTSATIAGATCRCCASSGASAGFEVVPVPLVARADGVDEPVSLHRHPPRPGRWRGRRRGPAARAAVRGTRHRRQRRPAGPAARLPDGQRRGAEPDLPARPTACTPAGTSGPTARSTRAPSTSAAARRSTSTPTTRCSRPTCSTSTTTSTASGPRCASCTFLRSERKFDGIDALVAQLKHDVEATRHALAESRSTVRHHLTRRTRRRALATR